jgi:hypothetical protein
LIEHFARDRDGWSYPMNRLDSKHREALTLPKACQWIGERTGKTPATSTAWRWVLRGVRGGIRLESFRLGGTTFTTPAMIRDFIARTSATVATGEATPASNGGSGPDDHEARRRQIAAAQEQLRQRNAPKRRRKADATTTRDNPHD